MDEHEIGKPFTESVETQYMPDAEFIVFVRSLPWSRKSLVSIEGKMRWVITGDDGVQHVLRPESARIETELQ
jgi:hypothetical protein